MKIWNEYASEHSMNLVMIGRFKEVRDAEEAEILLAQLTTQAEKEPDAYEFDIALKDRRFSDEMMGLLDASNFYIVSPTELKQLTYDVHVDLEGKEVVVTTDEVDVSVFLKVLLHKGGRVEVYSAHDYPRSRIGIEGVVEAKSCA